MNLVSKLALLLLCLTSPLLSLSQTDEAKVDLQLQSLLKRNRLELTQSQEAINPHKVELGRLLFFDKILSGNLDISCATCHHPDLASGDARSLPIGTGGSGLGHKRVLGLDRKLIPRNAPEIFNRGMSAWSSMFWDGRVEFDQSGGYTSPAGEALPSGLDSPLAVQALFPPTAPDEMRGFPGDLDIHGDLNTLAEWQPALEGDVDYFNSIWSELTGRVLRYPSYRKLLRKAYPDTSLKDFGIQHIANALAAFEISAFTFTDSPWDRYAAGELTALTSKQKSGALIFFGEGQCASCHSGPLFTDQKYYNLAVPQFGPGKNENQLDLGRYHVTGLEEDLYAFRTPPLRNVSLTGPWMHNGAYIDLKAAINHHLDPIFHLLNFDLLQLGFLERQQFHREAGLYQDMMGHVSAEVFRIGLLSPLQLDHLLAFLSSLSSPSAEDLSHIVPTSVPSGLPVRD